MPKTTVGIEPRVHTIYVYIVDGRAKASCDALYAKRGEKIEWKSATDGVIFTIKFNKNGSPFANAVEIKTGDNAIPITKLGTFDYSMTDSIGGPVVDPSVDVGDP